MSGRILIVFTVLLLLPVTFTSSVDAEIVTANKLKETTVTYNRKRERVFCNGLVPGSIRTSRSVITFTSFAFTLTKTSSRDKTKYNRMKSLVSLGKTECKRISKIIKSTPTPTPTPTSVPQTGNFDLAGNVTPEGKLLFGIPSALTANLSVGRAVFTAKCTGCHVERSGRTFLDVRNSIRKPPMLYDEVQIPDADLANLVAYLNRFRP